MAEKLKKVFKVLLRGMDTPKHALAHKLIFTRFPYSMLFSIWLKVLQNTQPWD